ncbi:MAG: CPBP family intramembrane metalloprotease, partial [Clostridiaceae bacterium]|nr:CPBP family intramembrane metalloprotease [Clostridiaceae bacterium]
MDYLREIKKTCSRLGVGYAAFLVVGLLLQMEAGLILGVLGSMGWRGDWNTWIVILGSLPTYLLGTLICWLIVKDMGTPCRPRKQPFGAGRLVVAFFACISIMYIGNIIGTVLMSIV